MVFTGGLGGDLESAVVVGPSVLEPRESDAVLSIYFVLSLG